ncbi:MAG: hypothetical protein R3C26_21595 [Calditrichia bacterium]
MELDGLAVQAVDTAGIRKTEDKIEAIGVQRAMEHIKRQMLRCAFLTARRVGRR